MYRFLLTIKNAVGLDIIIDVINENPVEDFTFVWKVGDFQVSGDQNHRDANSLPWDQE